MDNNKNAESPPSPFGSYLNRYMQVNDTIKNIEFIDWKDKIDRNYNNVIELSDILKTEQLINKNNNSQVKAIYPKE